VVLVALLVACGQPPPPPERAGAAGEALAARAAAPSVSQRPEGRLAFARGGNIWVRAGGQETQLTTDGAAGQPRWARDGGALLFVRRGDSYADLWVMDPTSGSARQLTGNRSTQFPLDSKAYVDHSFVLNGPTWARPADGGERIVYSTDADSANGTLLLMLRDGLDAPARPVLGTTDLPGHIEGAALSPDGSQIAFTYGTVDRGAPGPTQIYLVNLASGAYRALTSHAAGAYDPAWSPDGRWVAYAARQGNGTAILAIHPDGTGQRALVEGGSNRAPAWSPGGEQLAFVRLKGAGYGLFQVELTAPGGGLAAGRPQEIGDYSDLDPAAGVSWAR
jgi:TolB protein